MFKIKTLAFLLCIMSISGVEAKEEKLTGKDITTAKSFTKVDQFETKNLYADLVIKTHDKNEISVQADGTDTGLKSLEIYQDDNEVVVRSNAVPKKVFMTLGNIKIISSDTFKSEDKPKLTVYVPMKTKLDLAIIGDSSVDMATTNGELELKTAGVANVKGGDYEEAEIEITGAGTVTLNKVSDKFETSIAGTGSIQVANLKKAKVKITGAAKANLGNIEKGLDSKISGMGQIVAANIKDEIESEISGGGSLSIKTGDVKKVDLDISGTAKFDYGGRVQDASIKASGACSVHLNEVTGKLKKEVSGMASVKINQHNA